MKEIKLVDGLNSENIIEVMNKAEAMEVLKWEIEAFEDECYDEDSHTVVFYNDGTWAGIYPDEICGNGLTKQGKIKLRGIKTIIIDNGYTMQVYGDYAIVREDDIISVYDHSELPTAWDWEMLYEG